MPQGKPGNPLEYKKAGGILREGHTQLFFACVFLMAVGHGIFYGFFSIYLKQLGIVESAIGVQWAIAAGGELLIFLFASRILSAFSYRFLFSGCLLLAVVRWLLTYASDSYFVLCAAQSLHAFTFGVFHITSIRLVHAIFPQGYRSLGQSLLSASGAGLGLFTGVLVGGLLWDVQQGKAFLTSSIIVFAAFLLSLRFKPQG